ncbi:hypothetical protein D3C75_317880 [compost metagenome]
MSAHLAAVDGVFGAHPLFDKRMPGFRHHRSTACRRHHVHRVPGQTRVVDDLRPRVFFEEGFCQQADNVVALDKLPFLVEQEAAVKIAVEGNPHIGPVFDHRIAGISATLR